MISDIKYDSQIGLAFDGLHNCSFCESILFLLVVNGEMCLLQCHVEIRAR